MRPRCFARRLVVVCLFVVGMVPCPPALVATPERAAAATRAVRSSPISPGNRVVPAPSAKLRGITVPWL